MHFVTNVAYAAVRMATPLILAAMGGIIAHSSGMMNIGLEGMMLSGAFVAVVAAARASSLAVGVIWAVLTGVILGAGFAFFVNKLKTNLVITGLAMNLLALGGTSYALELLFHTRGSYAPKGLHQLPRVRLWPIDLVPVLGDILSGHTPIAYLAWVFAALSGWFLYRTVAGIRLRAVGESKESAAAAGIPVQRMQYCAMILCGMLCGLAGAQLSLGDMVRFNEGMTNGRGFMALAAYYFGGTRPGPTLLACLLFGFCDALQFRLQGYGAPPQIVQMLPYGIVVLTLGLVAVRRRQRVGRT